MPQRINSVITSVALSSMLLIGCQTDGRGQDAAQAVVAREMHSLTLIATELQMHLRSDPYRSARPLDSSGRDVFSMALWRLDRLQESRDIEAGSWTNADLVIEFARGRTLERLRRYSEAETAYRRVAEQGSLLQERAVEAESVMAIFAAASEPVDSSLPSEPRERAREERLIQWREIVSAYRGSPYESLALEEQEAWQTHRVERLSRSQGIETALAACHKLIEEHRASKHYARHLILLGDLYSEAARAELTRHRTTRASFDASRYDALLDRAFSAYELAGEQRYPSERVEASKKIEALLAAHRGALTYVR